MDLQISTYKPRNLKKLTKSERIGWYEAETALLEDQKTKSIVHELAEMDKHLRRSQKLQQNAIETSVLNMALDNTVRRDLH